MKVSEVNSPWSTDFLRNIGGGVPNGQFIVLNKIGNYCLKHPQFVIGISYCHNELWYRLYYKT